MNKAELVKAMHDQANGYFITKSSLARFVGVKRSETISRYVDDLQVFNKKYYFIPDVVKKMMEDVK